MGIHIPSLSLGIVCISLCTDLRNDSAGQVFVKALQGSTVSRAQVRIHAIYR